MFKRIKNLIVGFLSIFIKDLEAANPEVAYENAINSTTEKYVRARSAVAGIVAERQRNQARVNNLQTQLAQANADLDASLNTDDDELSAVLLQKKKQLEAQLATAMSELSQISEQVEKAKTDLMAVQAKIDELKRERETNLARYHSAQARQQLQDQLSGLSTEADIQALDNVREAIDRSVAHVSLNEEMAGTDIDRKLTELRKTSGASTAKNEVLALKAARQAAAAGAATGGGKSM